MILPTYEQATNRVAMEVETPLDLFISEHEPAGIAQCEQFRRDLKSLLEYVEKTVNDQWKNDFERLAVPNCDPTWNGIDLQDGPPSSALMPAVFMAVLILVVVVLASFLCA